MRLFVFAIGGTGARVLRSMVMQFAAGIVPQDTNGNSIPGLTVIPIIIDPHTDNAALIRANQLLLRYQAIRKSIYGDENAQEGFYAVKIDSLKDATTTKETPDTYKLPEGFFFDMPEIATEEFRNFIGLNKGMSPEAQLFSKMIFSEEELNTKMSEGFYGSPNIGTVALNVFQESECYKALVNNFGEDDRLFFVGSIFGGTGAAGLPMFVSSFRNYNDNTEGGSNAVLPDARMGATIVMPYFKIQNVENSPIQESDFIIKTQSALKYYQDNLYPYLNDVYYLADTDNKRKPFENDPGEEGQQHNIAHIVEFLGGLSIIDFAEQAGKTKTVKEGNRRVVAEGQGFWQFSYEADDSGAIMLLNLGKGVRNKIMTPMIQFHVFSSFLRDGHFEATISSDYAKRTDIDLSALTSDIEKMIDEYRFWLEELGNEANGNSRFIPFTRHTDANKDYKGIIAGDIDSNFDRGDIVSALNEKKNDYREIAEPTSKLMKMGFDATQKIVQKKVKVKK